MNLTFRTALSDADGTYFCLLIWFVSLSENAELSTKSYAI